MSEADKTSDKNVGGIEDDIKILENLKSYLNLLIYEGNDKIIYNDLLWDEKTVDCIYAMENLINDYTRQKQINEEHKKQNAELMKAINTVEKEKGEWIEECQQKDKRIQDLEEENYVQKTVIFEKCIPIQVIIDKIEENANIVKAIEKKIKEEENSGDICREYIRDLKRQKGLVKRDILTLQELLEGEK